MNELRRSFARWSNWLAEPRGKTTSTLFFGLLSLWQRWDHATEEHRPDRYLYGDMAIYAEQASRVFHVRDAWDTFTPPGYPAFLALIGDVQHLGGVQALLGAATTMLTMSLVRQLDSSPWTAILAGLMSAYYFPLIFYTGFALSETLFAFLLMSFVATALFALQKRRRLLAALAGLILGTAILTRPSLLTFLPFLAWMTIRHRRPNVLPHILVATLLTILPVALHTSYVLKRPAVVASNGGVNFFLAHSDCKSVRSNAGGRVVAVSTHYSRMHYTRECVVDPPFIDEPFLYDAALRSIKRDPARLLRAFDGLREGLGIAPYRNWPYQPYWPGSSVDGDRINAYSRAFFWVLLLPALIHSLVGRFRSSSAKLAHRLSWALLASVGVAIYVYNGNPRVRVSSDPIAIALAAVAFVGLVRYVARKIVRRLNLSAQIE